MIARRHRNVAIGCLLLAGWICSSWISVSAAAAWQQQQQQEQEYHAFQQDDNNDAYFLLCLADGSIYSMHAWTGSLQSKVVTSEPLLQHQQQQQHEQQTMGSMVPGLDGRLYWQSSSSSDNDDSGTLQELPVSMASLLEHPVQSCHPLDPTDCGIWTATAKSSIWGWSAVTGDLVWTTDSSDNDNKEPPRTTGRTLLLQRKDYQVEQLSVDTGNVVWNVSVGTYHALDFEPPKHQHARRPTQRLSIDDDDDISNDFDDLILDATTTTTTMPQQTHKETLATTERLVDRELPLVVFSQGGHRLTALDPETGSILWRQEVPAVLASVFAMQNGQWKSLTVLEEPVSPNHHQHPRTLFLTATEVPSQEPDYAALWKEYERRQEELLLQQQQNRPIQLNPVLLLPSQQQQQEEDSKPPLLLLPNAPPGVVQPEGLLLSWSTVAMLLGFILVSLAAVWRILSKKSVSPNIELSTTGSMDKEDPTSSERRLALAPNAKPDRAVSDATTTDTATTLSMPLTQRSRYREEYVEVEPIGSGGFGTVFRCRMGIDGQEYAIKKVRISGKGASFKARLDRVLREVRFLARLEHPHIVRYYTSWMEEDDEDTSLTQLDASSSHLISHSEWTTDTQPSPLGRSRRHKKHSVAWSETSASLHRQPPHLPVLHDDRDDIVFEESTTNRQDDDDEPWAHRGMEPYDDGIVFEESTTTMHLEEEVQEDNTIVFESSTTVGTRQLESSKTTTMQEQSSGGFLQTQSLQSPSSTIDNHGQSHPVQEQQNEKDKDATVIRHILYISMQLCSRHTVADYLAHRGESVNLHEAISMFLQISQAVDHVHKQGLIHRDLKPSNCFIMEETSSSSNTNNRVVKVGDFGLSRESSSAVTEEHSEQESVKAAVTGENHTAGVGTRSYASPEQMEGSDYDSSTDIYSLGIMLFELLYPMTTGMERSICLTRLRQGIFPADWPRKVGTDFPSLQGLIQSMLAATPANRPSAAQVVQDIQSLVGQWTMVSQHPQQEAIYLRVEGTMPESDALTKTTQLIQAAADCPLEILQCGLKRGSESVSMEFSIQPVSAMIDLPALEACPGIVRARQVSSGGVPTYN